jgi:hypothetical protein
MPLHSALTGADLHAPGAHKTQHEDGGTDEISLTGLTGAPILTTATTAVTQSQADNSTKVATTAYVDAAAAAILDGATFSGDIVVPDEAYDATAWNGSLEVPTKNAVRDKIESLASGGALDDLTDVDTTGVSDGDVLTFDSGSGDWIAAAPSSPGGGGGMVLLGTYTAAASATLDIVTRTAAGQSGAIFQTDFDVYAFEVINMIPATNAVYIYLRVSTNGGSSYVSSGDYSWIDYRYIVGGAATGGAAAQTQIEIDGGGGVNSVNNTSTRGLCGSFKLFSPTDTAVHTTLHGETSHITGSTRQAGHVTATYEQTTAVNAFQVYASSGNLTSGKVRVYGLAQ